MFSFREMHYIRKCGALKLSTRDVVLTWCFAFAGTAPHVCVIRFSTTLVMYLVGLQCYAVLGTYQEEASIW
jgi:hypothetical protein